MNKSFFICLFLFFIHSALHAQWNNIPGINNQAAIGGNTELYQAISDGLGGTIIIYQLTQNGNIDVYAQKINADGNIAWAAMGVPVCVMPGNQVHPREVTDGNGGVIITWLDGRNIGSSDLIYCQRINASGTPQWTVNGVAILNSSASATFPENASLVSDENGGAIITWCDERNFNGFNDSRIYAQKINSNGVVQWNLNGVALSDLHSELGIASASGTSKVIVADGNGGAIIGWQDFPGITISYANLFVQRIDASGVLRWQTNGIRICTGDYHTLDYQLVKNDQKGAIIGWRDFRTQLNIGCYAQSIDSAGVLQWPINGVPVYQNILSYSILSTTMIDDGHGGAVFAWHDFRENLDNTEDTGHVYAQRIDRNGIQKWNFNGLPIGYAQPLQRFVDIAYDSISAFIFTWADYRNDPQFADIYAERIDSNGISTCGSSGVPVSTGPGDKFFARVINNFPHEGIVAWTDLRPGTPGIYISKIVWPPISNSISITASATNICPGNTVNFTATVINPGNNPVYQWRKNGIDVGTNANIYVDGTLNDQDIIYCILTSSDACNSFSTVNSNKDTITVSATGPSGFLPAEASICTNDFVVLQPTGNYNQFLWSNNASTPAIKVTQPGLYWLKVTDSRNCSGTDTVLVKLKECIKGFYIPTSFTPNGDAINQLFKPMLFGDVSQYKFSVYDRYGEIVFTSTKIGEGWNGTIKGVSQNTSTFVWICTYQFRNQMIHIEKGSVLLIK